MTFTVCKHRKYIGGDVLESKVEVDSLNDVLGLVRSERLSEKVFGTIGNCEVGHYFVDGEEFVYQIVIK